MCYRFAAWDMSAVTTGKAKLRIRDNLNGLQQGSITYLVSVVLSLSWQMITAYYVT